MSQAPDGRQKPEAEDLPHHAPEPGPLFGSADNLAPAVQEGQQTADGDAEEKKTGVAILVEMRQIMKAGVSVSEKQAQFYLQV